MQVATSTQPQTLPIDSLKSYPNHKYELYTGEKLVAMVDEHTVSCGYWQEHGIIQPVIVWKKDGEYIILAGHNRVNAAEIAEVTDIPVIIKENLVEDEVRFIVNVTNLKTLISIFVFFFNFVRPHSVLGGLTPAQVAGLKLSKKQKREYFLVA